MKPYFERDGVTLYHGDCREVLPGLGRFDLLLTDPPYGINADEEAAKNNGKFGWKYYGDSSWDAERPSVETLTLARASADNAIIWGGNYFADLLRRRWDGFRGTKGSATSRWLISSWLGLRLAAPRGASLFRVRLRSKTARSIPRKSLCSSLSDASPTPTCAPSPPRVDSRPIRRKRDDPSCRMEDGAAGNRHLNRRTLR